MTPPEQPTLSEIKTGKEQEGNTLDLQVSSI